MANISKVIAIHGKPPDNSRDESRAVNILADLKQMGIGTSCSYALARLILPLPFLSYHRYRLIAVHHAGMPAMPRGFTARTLTLDTLCAHQIDASVPVQEQRFSAGLTCLGAFDEDGVLVGVNWLAEGQFDEDEVYLRYVLPAGAAWDTGLWIPPEKRLSRAFAAIWAGTGAWLRERGLGYSMSRIADYNLGSLNAHLRMHAQDLGCVSALGIGNTQLTFGASRRISRKDDGEPPMLRLPELP